ARAALARRRAREKQATRMPEPEAPPQDAWAELRAVLDRELGLLPGKYRAVVLLCDLEGKTRKEAAAQLDVPEGTVAGRLARGRAMLAKRLVRHGVTVSGAALVAGLAQGGVPASAAAAAIKAAALGGISAEVAALTEGVLRAMLLSKLKSVALASALILCAPGFFVGALTYGAGGAEPPRQTAAAPAKSEEKAKPEGRGGDVKQAQAVDELQRLIDQVLKAYGGEEEGRGLKAFTEKIKYTDTDGKEVAETHVLQPPNKYRIEIRRKGEAAEDVYIFAGEVFRRWRLHDNGKVEELHFLGLEPLPEYWIDVITYY